MKKIIAVIISAAGIFLPFSVFAISPTTASVSNLSDFQAISITAMTNSVVFAVDMAANKGIANQNAATPTFNLDLNGATGWNGDVNHSSRLSSIAAGSVSVAFPTITTGFNVRVYDTANAGCYTDWSDPATGCAGETHYLDITFSGGGGPVALASNINDPPQVFNFLLYDVVYTSISVVIAGVFLLAFRLL